jgi:hypothetical protein
MTDKFEIFEATGRSKCPVCHQVVADCKQVKIKVTGRYARNYHVDCFKNEHWTFIADLYLSLTDAERQDLESMSN